MQKSVNKILTHVTSMISHSASKRLRLYIEPAPGKRYKEPTTTVNGQRLQVVDKFTYLGSILSRVVHIDDEVNARIAKASAAFGRLCGSIWDQSGIRGGTNLSLQICDGANTVIRMPNLDSLPACQKTEPLPYKLFRKLLKLKWQDRIPDTEVLKRAGMQSVCILLKLAHLRWTGYVTRMPVECLAKKILCGELQVGKRSHGGQKKRYKDTLNASLKDQHTNRVMGTDCTGSSKVVRPHNMGFW